jgi:hypothetical protein
MVLLTGNYKEEFSDCLINEFNSKESKDKSTELYFEALN